MKSISVAKALLVGFFATMFSITGHHYALELENNDGSLVLLFIFFAVQIASGAMALHLLFKEE